MLPALAFRLALFDTMSEAREAKASACHTEFSTRASY